RVDIGQGDVSWVVMADIEENEFCVLKSLPKEESA
ncbi:MAG TPA: VOC family protein, partial [Candidatus Limnocylindria bacterium]